MNKRNRHGNYLGGSSIEGSRSGFYARMAHRKRMTEKCLQEAKQERERFAAERKAFASRPKWTLIVAGGLRRSSGSSTSASWNDG
jgi:hypothetical protein